MKYGDIKKILYMDSLIQRECTGSPDQFAKRLNLSRSALFEYLTCMRDIFMVEIVYNRYAKTYYYVGEDLCSVLGGLRCSTCKERACLQ